ncbi:MAG: hypothetical protein JF611_11520, partial [Betaproteobacteria bacterium]|nr:hypothetical protein [Betaproteobacteria bacterium]
AGSYGASEPESRAVIDWATAHPNIFSSIWSWATHRGERKKDDAEPADMDSMSLIGGGLIAGEAIAFLTLGIIGLLSLAR